jgi:hypothetical protein
MTINADPGGRRGGDPPDGGTDADDDHEDCGQPLGCRGGGAQHSVLRYH